jgi:hypothetical protein
MTAEASGVSAAANSAAVHHRDSKGRSVRRPHVFAGEPGRRLNIQPFVGNPTRRSA